MERVLSTLRFVKQPLSPSLLSELTQSGVSQIELYCSPFHFDYRSPDAIRELAARLEEHHISLRALHSPTERDLAPGRDTGVAISISDPERIRRIDAMDEVKRALEVAERIPVPYLVQHLGTGRQSADPRKFDAAFNSLEHLSVFAKSRGVTIALENTADELGSPASLHQFLTETHLHDLKICFDIGHAQIEGGVASGWEILRDRAVLLHIHDNHGDKDEHLLPWSGSVDWPAALEALSSVPAALPLVLELKEQSPHEPSLDEIRKSFDRLEAELDESRARPARS
ncbi:MAG TPA: sugar phosphate isomerase/epimerase family protein [Candidatus Acidoferrum sp.]|nr:sugar phosphate isomerase/epimerase family protein [Candidatus Acidoferrum sp.]